MTSSRRHSPTQRHSGLTLPLRSIGTNTGTRCSIPPMLNTCYNAVDLHVAEGRGGQRAIIYDSPVTDTVRSYTYAELLHEVRQVAGALAELGVGKGDRVIIYMPMIPEAVFAMLACARLGAVHSVVFGGFAANELAVRSDDCTPKASVCASCGIEPGRIVEYKPLVDEAIELAAQPPAACIVLQRAQAQAAMTAGRDFDWDDIVPRAVPQECVSVEATDPLYILYTSGTTGQPKGVVRDNGGHVVALKWTMEHIYGVEPGEVYWAASDIGWVVGHSYIVYAPLFNGNTTIVFEGKPVGTPDPGTFWRVIAEHGVSVLFTAPTAFRAIKKEDPDGALIGNYDLSGFRTLFLAGERTDPATLHWARDKLGVPVIDHWWQTETGWSICGRCRVWTCGLSTTADGKWRAVRLGHWWASCRFPQGRSPRCGMRRSGTAKLISTSFPATTRPPMPGTWTRRAMSSLCQELTTSSTSQGIGSRPGRWKRCSQRIRTWLNVRSPVWPTA